MQESSTFILYNLQKMLFISLILTFFAFETYAHPIHETRQPLKIDFSVVKGSKLRDSTSYGNALRFGNGRALKDGPQSSLIMQIENHYFLYVANLNIGTPSQTVQVQIDTGSSDLWVPASNSTKEVSTFDNTKSKTFGGTDFGVPFEISYADHSNAKGSWVSDDIQIGDVTVPKVVFGLVSSGNAGQGVLGLGLPSNEAITWKNDGLFVYANLPLKLRQYKIINRAAYSLYLNSQDAEKGSILFGGIDKAKFKGPLQILPLIKVNINGYPVDDEEGFYVNIDGIKDGNSTYMNETLPALLDSGTTLTYAPFNVVNAIGRKYGKYNRMLGGYITSCKTKGDPIQFQFNNTTVSVPFNNLLYSLSKESDIYTEDECMIGILQGQRKVLILGENFLRSAYVMYDIEKKECGIAQAVYTDKTEPEMLPEMEYSG